MANKISNIETILRIIDLIHDGYGDTFIRSELQIGRKPIHRIAKDYGVLKELKYNNQFYKTNKYREISNYKRLIYYKNLDLLYGKSVDIIVKNGGILNDIIKIMVGVPHKKILGFLEYKNVNEIRKQNSKEYVSNIARINGRKSALTLSNKELKPITPEIVKRFTILKDILKYKQKVYDALKEEFGFGEKKCHQLCKRYGYPLDNPQTGELNPMYGKSPGKNAGIGVKCWLLHGGIKYFCRSSLELKVMCYFIDKKIPFQISKHRIPYIDDGGNKRTYCPDVVITDNDKMVPHLYEIKPHMMTFIRNNVIKSNAAKEYCKKFGMEYGWFITEKRLDLAKYNLQYIMDMIDDKIVNIDDKNLEKLKRNII